MVFRRTNFGERSEPAPDRGGKLQSAGAAQSSVSPLVEVTVWDKLFEEFVMRTVGGLESFNAKSLMQRSFSTSQHFGI